MKFPNCVRAILLTALGSTWACSSADPSQNGDFQPETTAGSAVSTADSPSATTTSKKPLREIPLLAKYVGEYKGTLTEGYTGKVEKPRPCNVKIGVFPGDNLSEPGYFVQIRDEGQAPDFMPWKEAILVSDPFKVNEVGTFFATKDPQISIVSQYAGEGLSSLVSDQGISARLERKDGKVVAASYSVVSRSLIGGFIPSNDSYKLRCADLTKIADKASMDP